MSSYISEFFGYKSEDTSIIAKRAARQKICPFLQTQCTKVLRGDVPIVSGVCSLRLKTEGSPSVICCPNRIYAEDYKILYTISKKAFGRDLNLYAGRAAVDRAKMEHGAVAVFGHGWGGELRLPQRAGTGAYFVDWVLVKLDGNGLIEEFTAIEVQTIDTTGNYRSARNALLENREIIEDTAGFNWENVAKRIIPQIIYKGQVLQREDLCRTGLFFVSPKPVHDRILKRLGGEEHLPKFPMQPASITFIAYDYSDVNCESGHIQPLKVKEEFCTTVYKVQEAFSAVTLPEGNVFRDAIIRSLYQ